MSKQDESPATHKATDKNVDSTATEARLLQRVRDQLDQQVALQDGSTRSALNRARAEALAVAESRATGAGFAWQWPAGFVAAGLAAVLLLPSLWEQGDSGEAGILPPLADLQTATALIDEIDSDALDAEALALLDSLADTDLEFYNDIAFIEWLDEQPDVLEEDPNQAHISVQERPQHVG